MTGSFHIAPASQAKASSKLGQLLQPAALGPDEVDHFNVTHQIKRLSFGTDFPGQTNPLDAASTYSPSGAAISRYFLKVAWLGLGSGSGLGSGLGLALGSGLG